MSEVSEEPEEFEPQPEVAKPKRERSPAQLAALKKARELANAKRSENAELKRKEKEIKQKEQTDRKRAIEKEYQQKMVDEEPKKKPIKEEEYLDETPPQIKSLIRKIDFLVERKIEKEERRRQPEPKPQPEIKRSLFFRGYDI